MTTAPDLDLRSLVAEGARAVNAVARGGGDHVVQAATALAWAHDVLGDHVVLASSMSGEVLLHLASKVAPGLEVVFLDTGYHFAETLGMRDAVATTYDLRVRTIAPRQTVAEQDAALGPALHARNPDRCCALRKVEPLERALDGYDAWISGIRRDEASTRRDVPVVGWDERRSMVKINPLAAWTAEQEQDYAAEHHVLLHPLRQLGYASIGCEPCTRPVAPGEDERAGRWAGLAKTECGLHL